MQEINEIKNLENQENLDNIPNPDKKFRRANDAVQYQVFVSILKAYDKTLNLLKYTLLVMIVAIIFVYNSFSNDTTREDYQIRMINDIILKLDDLEKIQSGSNSPPVDKAKILERILDVSHNTKQCGACHNSNNVIKIYTSWSYNDFKNYMRGIKRIPQNTIMPNYTKSELSDLDIEKMYEILKDGR
mgnify:CR=1 FL=1